MVCMNYNIMNFEKKWFYLNFDHFYSSLCQLVPYSVYFHKFNWLSFEQILISFEGLATLML